MAKFLAWDFYTSVRLRQRKTGERLGQAAFNVLYEIAPEIADAIRGTDKDPFYSNENWYRFASYIEDYLSKSTEEC